MLFPGRDDWNPARDHAGMDTTDHADMHGGELETSILPHTYPALVPDSYRSAAHRHLRRPSQGPHRLINSGSDMHRQSWIDAPSANVEYDAAARLRTGVRDEVGDAGGW